jgi:hypothetical protein
MQKEASDGFSLPQFEQVSTGDAIPHAHANASGRRSKSQEPGSIKSSNVLGNDRVDELETIGRGRLSSVAEATVHCSPGDERDVVELLAHDAVSR